VLADDVENPLRRSRRESRHVAPEGRAEVLLDSVGFALETGVDLPAVAARRAPAGLAGFEHRDGDAALRQMECRRQPRVARPDHDRLGMGVTRERRRRGAFARCLGVEAARQGTEVRPQSIRRQVGVVPFCTRLMVQGRRSARHPRDAEFHADRPSFQVAPSINAARAIPS